VATRKQQNCFRCHGLALWSFTLDAISNQRSIVSRKREHPRHKAVASVLNTPSADAWKTRSFLTLFIACVLAPLLCDDVVTKAGFTRVGTQAIVKVLHVTPPVKGGDRYLYVPIRIPPHTSRISISYRYDHAND